MLSFENFDVQAELSPRLSMDEAIEEARRLREKDKDTVYRVLSTDDDASSFRVEGVPREQAEAEILAAFSRRLISMTHRWKVRRRG